MKRNRLHLVCGLALWACLVAGCERTDNAQSPATGPSIIADVPVAEPVADTAKPMASPPIVMAARRQIGKTTVYDGAYVALSYPGGDVPIQRGVCTDVVVRALRDAHGMDLQQLVHEDMARSFSKYPTIWGLSKPDRNIDHRRVPNLQTYFERQGFALTTGREPEDFEPGDLVSCMVGNRPHIMVVTDKQTPAGVPLVIHNIGRGTQEEDRLFDFRITGQYRVEPTGH